MGDWLIGRLKRWGDGAMGRWGDVSTEGLEANARQGDMEHFDKHSVTNGETWRLGDKGNELGDSGKR